MNVSLTPQLEAVVKAKVATGRYQSASEVIREALRLLDEYDRHRSTRLAEARHDVAVGLDQLDRGQATQYDDASLGTLAEDIKSRGRVRLHKKRGA